MPNQLFDIQDAAKRLSLSVPTMYRWVREGRLPVVRLSARVLRFREADLDRFVNRNATEERPGA